MIRFRRRPGDSGSDPVIAGRHGGVDGAVTTLGDRSQDDIHPWSALPQPSPTASAVSTAVRLPLNLSGAITTRIDGS